MKKTEETMINEMPLESEASAIKRTKALLDKEPKVRVKVKPFGKGDKSPITVTINECCFTIKKDEYVEVPESVARLLEEANYI